MKVRVVFDDLSGGGGGVLWDHLKSQEIHVVWGGVGWGS
jgi:hypothetical protein